MKKISVNLGKHSYDIIIGTNILNNLPNYLKALNLNKNIFIITNPTIKKLYGQKLLSILIKSGYQIKFCCVPDTEKSKSIKIAIGTLRRLTLFDKGKTPFIMAFGGGVAGDLSGFLASIYKRGIPYIVIPTTLLSQVDSSIGGKTAIDLDFGKNLIGTFYQPRLVFVDISFLKSLSKNDLASGLSEIIKYAILKNKNFFSFIETNYKKILNKNSQILEYLVYRCASIKAKIVQQDEKEEKGIRTLLNLGHTIGHAIEAAGGYSLYNHGEAISLGLLCASNISNRLGMLQNNEYQRIINLIKQIGLLHRIHKIKTETIMKAISFDKKIVAGTLRFVLPIKIGKAMISTNISRRLIEQSIRKYGAH